MIVLLYENIVLHVFKCYTHFVLREVVSIHRSPGYGPGGFPLPYPVLSLICYFHVCFSYGKKFGLLYENIV